MIVAEHPGEFGFRHVAGFALAAFAVWFVMRMSQYIADEFFVAGQAGIVCFIAGEPVASAGGVAMDAVELSGFVTRVHHPTGKRIVFAKVSAIRVEVGVFKGDKIVMVIVFLAGYEAFCNRAHLCVARSAHAVDLFDVEIFRADQVEFFWLFFFAQCFLELVDMLG